MGRKMGDTLQDPGGIVAVVVLGVLGLKNAASVWFCIHSCQAWRLISSEALATNTD